MASVTVKPLTEHQIRGAADGYLSRFNPTGQVPVEIEDIIEIDHKIDVVGVENLRAKGHEAYTGRDRRTIYIDNGIYLRDDPNRRRFTLAHEVAHIQLHGYVFDAADYKDVDGWKAFLASMADSDVKELEQQAYKFAGLILVPSASLSAVYTKVGNELQRAGMDIRTLPPEPLRRVAKHIGEHFRVSHNCIHRCAVRDKLWRWDAIPNA